MTFYKSQLSCDVCSSLCATICKFTLTANESSDWAWSMQRTMPVPVSHGRLMTKPVLQLEYREPWVGFHHHQKDGDGVCLEVMASNLAKSSLHSTTPNIKIKSCEQLTFFYNTLLQPCKLDYHCNRTKTLGCISGTELNYLARSNTDANANELIWACSLNWNDEPFPHSVFLRYLLSSRRMIWWCYRKQNTAFILCNGRLASCNSKICFVLICYKHNTFIANV